MQDIRNLVYLSLISCIENERFSNLEADSQIARSELNYRDRAFYTAFFYGVIEKQITLDHQIKKLSKTPIEKLQTKALVILRMGLYQLLYMNSIPDHAAINETVALAKIKLNRGAVGYINGMLRSAQRELKGENGEIKLFVPDKDRDVCGYLSITYSFPRYLCKLWVNAYGTAAAERIMQAQNERNITTIQVNTLKTDRSAYLKRINELGLSAEASSVSDSGIHLVGNAPITSLPDFDNGYFFVQDDSSRLCVEMLGAKEGETVLDACACPGGKSFGSAIKMNNKGRIFSCDLHESKLSLIKSGANRLGINIIEAYHADSAVFKSEWLNKFDRVLCDVPCSGFGTVSKKPDLRLKKSDTLNELVGIQLSIVNNCSKYVKNGGTLVYSTCTLNPAENEENVKKFLEQNPNFELVEMKTNFPYENNYDGFFFAKMIKKL
ncbi:MAG: 16S rRNA (cytosine(967)-C(5))-methyltransferase RsmB [Clostridia bacterium]|nr:16S rRNA (cytosine(967)-C(5))-methyltransferase RsmB [Clostridia bacterium]